MKYEVVCMGNALLDFIVDVDDDILNKLGFKKGGMQLVSLEQSKDLLGLLKDHEVLIAPGGSAANVAAGIKRLGGRSFFMGSVGSDNYGKVYEELTKKDGIDCSFEKNKGHTGTAITFITHDLERTFATHLGAALELGPEAIVPNAIHDAKVLHFALFLLENENQKKACMKAIQYAKEHNALVSLDLSDSLWLEKHQKEAFEFLENVDIVFANEREAEALTGKEAEEAVLELGKYCQVAVVTMGKKGSVINSNGNIFHIDIYPIDEVNTNGAGDMYDAGFLWAIAQGLPVDQAGKIASFAAAQVVGSESARIDRSLVDDVKKLLDNLNN